MAPLRGHHLDEAGTFREEHVGPGRNGSDGKTSIARADGAIGVRHTRAYGESEELDVDSGERLAVDRVHRNPGEGLGGQPTAEEEYKCL
jgi:hypothetical protein